MTVGILSLILVVFGIVGFVIGRQRAIASAGGDARKLHSLPMYHGQSVFVFTVVPAFLFMLLWLLLQPAYIESRVTSLMSSAQVADEAARKLAMADIRRVAAGLDLAVAQGKLKSEDISAMRADFTDLRGRLAEVGVALGSGVSQSTFVAAKEYGSLTSVLTTVKSVLVLLIAAAGFVWSLSRISQAFRARNVSESFVIAMLIGASIVAVLTTFGIVFSLIFETWHFFELYPAKDFFFGTIWNPIFSGDGSSFGILPLLWGTLYISVIALLVAVPIGLLSAIYLSEYASRRVRTFVKPLIEILAGIPTIVYGLFAMITVGPLLRDWFAQPMGLGNSSTSVMTAGIVMGIMVIPFVSSLSDDIINAVPQSMRDGSLGLGATPSETIRKVVLPAALPGVVGAILLAASRAIGETMIVVLGAGAAAKLSLNPFEAMTTVTAKIVSQLTGDTEFGSPNTLVAFALGLTLFIITLGLNVIALVIVRKYREQYE
jgi:phosphate transport system permease protein